MAAHWTTLWTAIVGGLLLVAGAAPSERKFVPNTYDEEYGVFLGRFNDIANTELRGDVYLVNETAIQVIDFNFNGIPKDAYFWLSRTESPSKDGLKNANRIVLILPDQHRISEFKSLAVYSPASKTNYGSVVIPEDVIIPKAHFLPKGLAGTRYSIGSGPILILDARTIKIFAFTFDGDKAPDGYFFVGRGLNVDNDAGVKVPIRGRDQPDSIKPLNERYRGGQDIIIDLPEHYDVHHIDLLSVYCYKFRIDFGHVQITSLPPHIPPYVPPQPKYSGAPLNGAWALQPLLGTPARTNFTLHLGPAGGSHGYRAITGLRAPENVWYVNGYLAEALPQTGHHLRRGKENPFYISDDPFGGYSKLQEDEKQKVRLFAPKTPSEVYSDRRCVWENADRNPSTNFDNFNDFRKTLRLNCGQQDVGTKRSLTFTPTNSTPALLYGNSYGDFNMGFKIRVVDELPENIPDIQEPLQFEAWVHNSNVVQSFSLITQPAKWLFVLVCFYALR
ncbi:Protein Skeletor, isoforms D/E [Aphelenchoides fujianensis]|nr:Protein Skeletor, isoforms D/E [Aphelenchoides fujianensis]